MTKQKPRKKDWPKVPEGEVTQKKQVQLALDVKYMEGHNQCKQQYDQYLDELLEPLVEVYNLVCEDGNSEEPELGSVESYRMVWDAIAKVIEGYRKGDKDEKKQ